MLRRSLAVIAASIALTGCGDSSKNDAPQTTSAPPAMRRQPVDDEEKPEPADPADAACYRALKSVVGAKAETYCKINGDDKVCQWLYIGPDGSVLFDQRSNEEIDKEGSSVALSCAEAASRFPPAH